MAMRPLDRLPSIRAKLGSVIVFAVAVTILILYIAMGFALRRSERDREDGVLMLGRKHGAVTPVDTIAVPAPIPEMVPATT